MRKCWSSDQITLNTHGMGGKQMNLQHSTITTKAFIFRTHPLVWWPQNGGQLIGNIFTIQKVFLTPLSLWLQKVSWAHQKSIWSPKASPVYEPIGSFLCRSTTSSKIRRGMSRILLTHQIVPHSATSWRVATFSIDRIGRRGPHWPSLSTNP